MEIQPESTLTKNKKLIIALAGLGLILIIVSALYFFQSKEMNLIVENLTEEKNILTEEYQRLIVNFDSLQSDNDTLNLMLQVERERIHNLVEELKTIRATNTAKIREYERELTTLRGVLRTYIFQIDSLNARNIELTKDNIEQRRRVAEMQTSVRQLETVRANLEQKVTIASRLEISGIKADGLNASGRTTDRSSRTSKIRICFTLMRNVTAPVGMKDIYLRIERPDGQLLMHSRDDLFTHEGSRINYSAMRSIEYGGESTEVCIFYDADMGELLSGEYVADIFADGFHIGNHKFALR
ncbi:MCP four helix bundle domain-containing protein [Alkaliflexus imshenetskii]|uniref:hypothetical protein n=1 Tax=Alkaliflexus imshenetskii TaxID=286730 RepID=UPI00047B1297|nr:hypothetical protein [Alkaliflexus imshenetskii]